MAKHLVLKPEKCVNCQTRLLREALTEGPAKGKVTDLATMLKDYYSECGWNEEGTPTEEKIVELAL
jgi:aldehyde:ferredoxin oxidoreductase